MALLDKPQSFDEKWDGAWRLARRAALGAWGCGLTSVGLAWAQARWYVFHPHYLPLCLLFAGLGVFTFVALLGCLWRFGRGPRRVRAVILAVVAVLPVGFWAYVGVTAQRNHQCRRVPNTFAMRLAQVMGAAFMRADVDLRYRHRLQSKRLVMFYDPRNPEHPERVDRPERDLAAMDAHLARLEQMLGGTISSKVYWVRGRALGLEYLSYHGLSLGSAGSPEVGEQFRGDRHELAHAALDSFRVPGSDPPYLLHEGWAMSQCGDGWLELARAAADSRRENPAIGVRELLGPDWYHRDSGPVYSVGGAFVDFLVRSRGGARFRRFYVECQPDTFEAKCREIFETALDDLEAEFWDDVQKAVAATLDRTADSAQTDAADDKGDGANCRRTATIRGRARLLRNRPGITSRSSFVYDTVRGQDNRCETATSAAGGTGELFWVPLVVLDQCLHAFDDGKATRRSPRLARESLEGVRGELPLVRLARESQLVAIAGLMKSLDGLSMVVHGQ